METYYIEVSCEDEAPPQHTELFCFYQKLSYGNKYVGPIYKSPNNDSFWCMPEDGPDVQITHWLKPITTKS